MARLSSSRLMQGVTGRLMDEIRAHERGRMYAALVKSYRYGWTPFEAAALFCGFWPDTYDADDECARLQIGIAPDWMEYQGVNNAEEWFSDSRDVLESQFSSSKSPIVALFDELKRNDEISLLMGMARKKWAGRDALNYLSWCPFAWTERVDSRDVEYGYCESEELERLRDYFSVREELLPVMSRGVLSSYECEFYGDRAPNKFNRSKDGMDLPHPVGCFRRFSREHLEPKGFKPPIFKIAEEIEAAEAAKRMRESEPRSLAETMTRIGERFSGLGDLYEKMKPTAESMTTMMDIYRPFLPSPLSDAPTDPEANDALKSVEAPLEAAEVVAEPKVDPDSIEIVAGVTVGDVRKIFDKSGRRYRPQLAAAISVWCSFEREGVPPDLTAKTEAGGRLTDWEIENSKLGDNERKAVLQMVNWNKSGKRGR